MHSSHYPKLELKYCERCGGLWLRPQGDDAVYCAACTEAIKELPPVVPRGGSGTMQAACLSVVAFATTLLSFADCLEGVCQ
jgi:hypothetical protein